MMAGNSQFEDALNNLNANNPNFDVRFLLPLLIAHGTIDQEDRANIQRQDTLADAANMLFLNVMPHKTNRQQDQFFTLMEERKDVLAFVATKAFQEFLSYLSDKFPHFDVRLFLPQLVSQLIISFPERSIINNCHSPSDANNVLFLYVLPHKNPELLQRFINFLRKNHTSELAEYLTPRIDEFYSQKAPGTLSPTTPPVSKLQQPAEEEFLSANAIQTSHTITAYKKEYEALAISQNQIQVRAGHLLISIQAMKTFPSDMQTDPNDNDSNPYYAKNGKRCALIINNDEYRNPKMNRTGSVVDFDNMKNLLIGLGYEVILKQNRTARQMLDDITEFVGRIASHGDAVHSCVVVVMTHGELGWFIGVDEMILDQQRFFKVMTDNEAMAGKPKIFIVQACRGSKLDLKVTTPYALIPANDDIAKEIAKEEEDAAAITKIARSSDTCILYSTTPGYYSWRNTIKGSWFIQAICEEFSAHAHKPWADLVTLSTRVAGKFANHFPIQVPMTEISMTKKFHFFPNFGQPAPMAQQHSYKQVLANSLVFDCRSYDLELEALKFSTSIDIPETSGVQFLNVQPMAHILNAFQYQDYYYKNFTSPKGLALLISNGTYGGSQNRMGAYVDHLNMEILLRKLQYVVQTKLDRTAAEMKQDFKDFACSPSHELYDSAIVVILTLSKEGCFTGIDGQLLDAEIAFDAVMKSQYLEGKPKLFIVQACRASLINPEIAIGTTTNEEKIKILQLIKESERQAKKAFRSKLPSRSDTFILFSTTPGYYSWRKSEKASWFIQVVCQEISNNAFKPEADIMTLAMWIAIRIGDIFSDFNEYLEQPSMAVVLSKKFHFFPVLNND